MGRAATTALASTVTRSATSTVRASPPPGAETVTGTTALRVTVLAKAVVAARPITRHAVIGPEDVTLARVEMGGEAAIATPADVIGKRAVNALPAGRRLAASDIEEAPVLAANARVTVRVVSGAVEVTATGTAREEGRVGQSIRVRLDADPNRPGPAREVRARVADAQTVIVEE
jgi:flagella basal body P-ring formation protein FlgA